MSEVSASITSGHPPLHGTACALSAFHATGDTRPYGFRRRQLETLSRALEAHEDQLIGALHEDLRKPPQEAYAAEVGLVQSDIQHALRHLKSWMRSRKVRGPLLAWPSKGAVQPEPYGAALIISPWNYPVHLSLSPLVGAIAAGNCVCLKPSELAPATSRELARMMRGVFPPEYIAVVEGGREEAEGLLGQAFDCLFFTGSTEVGREVLTAAARSLTPAVLELGGKSPCIVCRDTPLEVAARRILWGKCLNAGQTCVAPDYVLADMAIVSPLLEAFGKALDAFYPSGARQSPDYARIVNRRHFDRLAGYLAEGDVALGGGIDVDDLFIEPTVLVDVPLTAAVMREEIFGPILPVLPFTGLHEAIAVVRGLPPPLALYAFTRDRATERRILAETHSGGACMNDTMSHAFSKRLPFGGVGASGMGAYHGKASFDCFTHYRSVLRRALKPDLPFRYPPVRASRRLLKRVYRFLVRN